MIGGMSFAFVDAPLDRAEHLRNDSPALAALWPQARLLLLDADGLALADAEALPVIDLYAAVAGLDKAEHMSDVFHWKETGKELQAEAICAFVRGQLGTGGGNVQLTTETGPDGAMK